jgi:hypothetical protein
MADKKNTCYNYTSGDNDNMNSAHIHCKLFWRAGHSSRLQPKEMKTQSNQTGGMTFRITSTQYGWKKIASITQLNPLKFKTWKYKEGPRT